ncbi:MAG: helix-turn-helix domain-containing protein [Flavonifractor plautii]
MFDFQQISRYRENNRLEAKLATGGLPRSIWETYSAFANTYGGVILLGVEELPDHTLRVQGLLEPRELVDEFTALLQNPRVVSANLLTPGDIQVLHVDGGDIVAITVPPAEQDQRPVYIGGDLACGSYRRSGDGDYHCTRAELNAMLGGRSH